MPQKRQSSSAIDEAAIAVRTLGLTLPKDHRIAAHRHGWHQLVYATEGVMVVQTSSTSWVVPPQRAVWIPAGFEHRVRTTGKVRMRTLYFRPALAEALPQTCSVIHISPLLRELILETMRLSMLCEDRPEQQRLALVLVDQILETRHASVEIRLPSDARAMQVARAAQLDLADPAPLAELAKGCGASVRTIERLFRKETGLTFGRWLQRVRALHALERLAAGDSVTEAGLAVGYDSTSAFIAMFKRTFGTTPGSYFSSREPRDNHAS